MLDVIKEALRIVRARRKAKRAATEKRAIAKAFNDRYTYLEEWVEKMPFLPGTSYGGPHRSGYAWMCPDCNQIHHPQSDSVFSGLQYPPCCTHSAGHRLHHGIKPT